MCVFVAFLEGVLPEGTHCDRRISHVTPCFARANMCTRIEAPKSIAFGRCSSGEHNDRFCLRRLQDKCPVECFASVAKTLSCPCSVYTNNTSLCCRRLHKAVQLCGRVLPVKRSSDFGIHHTHTHTHTLCCWHVLYVCLTSEAISSRTKPLFSTTKSTKSS